MRPQSVVALCLLAGCLGPSAPPVPPEPAQGTLRVLVLDPEQVPIRNATVRIQEAGLQIETGPDGGIEVRLPPAQYRVEASDDLRLPNATHVHVVANETTVVALVLKPEMRVYLVPTYEHYVFECGYAVRQPTLNLDGKCMRSETSGLRPNATLRVEANFTQARIVVRWNETEDQDQMLLQARLLWPRRDFADGRPHIHVEGPSPLVLEIPPAAVDAPLRDQGGAILLEPFLATDADVGAAILMRAEATFLYTHIGPR